MFYTTQAEAHDGVQKDSFNLLAAWLAVIILTKKLLSVSWVKIASSDSSIIECFPPPSIFAFVLYIETEGKVKELYSIFLK